MQETLKRVDADIRAAGRACGHRCSEGAAVLGVEGQLNPFVFLRDSPIPSLPPTAPLGRHQAMHTRLKDRQGQLERLRKQVSCCCCCCFC